MSNQSGTSSSDDEFDREKLTISSGSFPGGLERQPLIAMPEKKEYDMDALIQNGFSPCSENSDDQGFREDDSKYFSDDQSSSSWTDEADDSHEDGDSGEEESGMGYAQLHQSSDSERSSEDLGVGYTADDETKATEEKQNGPFAGIGKKSYFAKPGVAFDAENGDEQKDAPQKSVKYESESDSDDNLAPNASKEMNFHEPGNRDFASENENWADFSENLVPSKQDGESEVHMEQPEYIDEGSEEEDMVLREDTKDLPGLEEVGSKMKALGSLAQHTDMLRNELSKQMVEIQKEMSRIKNEIEHVKDDAFGKLVDGSQEIQRELSSLKQRTGVGRSTFSERNQCHKEKRVTFRDDVIFNDKVDTRRRRRGQAHSRRKEKQKPFLAQTLSMCVMVIFLSYFIPTVIEMFLLLRSDLENDFH